MAESSAVSELKKLACEAIDANSKELQELNRKIWENPELCFKETISHGILTEFFEKHQFQVTRKWTLDTAFGATYGGSQGPCVGVICEYDALPEVGHACGHNLIAEAGAAAALGIKAALEKTGNKLGRLLVLGTPAEEGGGGKCFMIENGCFEKVDFSMMVHPSKFNLWNYTALDVEGVEIIFKGIASHAAAFPWEGVNALDAAVMAYSSISMMRQQMKPSWRVHGVILEGGVKPNIIPDRTRMNYFFRAPNRKELEELKAKVIPCFEASAKATGCTVEIVKTFSYENFKANSKLAGMYKANAKSMGIKFMSREEEAKLPKGSTDMGNVSHVVPSIQPMYDIDTDAPNHSHAFTSAAATDAAHQRTLTAAKAMAMTAIEVMSDPHTLETVKKLFVESE